MGLNRLFLSALERVFLRPFFTLIIVFSIVFQSSAPTLWNAWLSLSPSYSPFTTDALAGRSFFFVALRQNSFKAWTQRTVAWWKGDPELASVRLLYSREIIICLGILAVDSALTLKVPFIGQTLYDTAARGNETSGSWGAMLLVSALFVGAELLDPLHRYARFRLARLRSRFIAHVRTFLLLPTLERNDLALAQRAKLLYLHSPAFAVRNIDVRTTLPHTIAHGLLSGWILWRMDAIVAMAAVLTTVALGLWSRRLSTSLAMTMAHLREAESEALNAIETLFAKRDEPSLIDATQRLQTVQRREVQQTAQDEWFHGVVDRVGTLVLMTGVMLWGLWHQYATQKPTTGEIMAVLALAWQVQYRISAFLAFIKSRLEAESAAFLLPSHKPQHRNFLNGAT